MKIEDIEKLAELAKIDLTLPEKEALLKDLASILGYVKQVESVEVPEIKVDYDNKNIWREDKSVSRVFSRRAVPRTPPGWAARARTGGSGR